MSGLGLCQNCGKRKYLNDFGLCQNCHTNLLGKDKGKDWFLHYR